MGATVERLCISAVSRTPCWRDLAATRNLVKPRAAEGMWTPGLDAFSLGCQVINTHPKNCNQSLVSPTERNIAAYPLPLSACTCVKFEIKSCANFNKNNYGYPPYLCHSSGLPGVSMGVAFCKNTLGIKVLGDSRNTQGLQAELRLQWSWSKKNITSLETGSA